MTQARDEARREIAFCEEVLAKGGLNVLTEALRDAQGLTVWTHYPEGDVYDPASGAQWFYHSHPVDDPDAAIEHGHFHCFVRPQGASGPIHHLICVGVDSYGRLVRLFTVNHWVVGDDWLDAEATIGLLDQFDVHMPRPSYLVNRWLTAVLRAYDEDIRGLIRARDECLDARRSDGEASVFEDRSLEITSELRLR